MVSVLINDGRLHRRPALAAARIGFPPARSESGEDVAAGLSAGLLQVLDGPEDVPGLVLRAAGVARTAAFAPEVQEQNIAPAQAKHLGVVQGASFGHAPAGTQITVVSERIGLPSHRPAVESPSPQRQEPAVEGDAIGSWIRTDSKDILHRDRQILGDRRKT